MHTEETTNLSRDKRHWVTRALVSVNFVVCCEFSLCSVLDSKKCEGPEVVDANNLDNDIQKILATLPQEIVFVFFVVWAYAGLALGSLC